jgi:hypothetical protein
VPGTFQPLQVFPSLRRDRAYRRISHLTPTHISGMILGVN